MSVAMDDIERASSALWALPPGMGRDQWFRTLTAAQAAGLDFDTVHTWCSQGANYAGQQDVASVWRSITPGGGITAATLFGMAREAGWMDDGERPALPAPVVPTEAADAARKARQAHQVRDMWARGADAPADHPYIVRKGGTSDGLRMVSWPLSGWAKFKGASLQGWLMVPMLDAAGEVCSIQFIGPQAGEKLNAAATMGVLTMGDIQPAQPAYAVEGVGHAWTLRAVTGQAVVVAFGASNMKRAAAAIKRAGGHPVLVPDRGQESNAVTIANALGCQCATLPDDMPPGADVNDLHQQRGADAVRLVLDATRGRGAAVAHVPAAGLPLTQPLKFSSWPDCGSQNKPLPTLENMAHMLAAYGITCRYNVIGKRTEIRIPGANYCADSAEKSAIAQIISLCGRNQMSKAEAIPFLGLVADVNRCNPVMDWIESRPWDGRTRFADLVATVQTSAGYDRSLFAMLLRRWLTSAVAAAAGAPDFASHGVLVFAGKQGRGKGRWFQRLVGANGSLFQEIAKLDPANKDSVMTAVSHWLIELGELDSTFRKADIAHLKSFVTQKMDKLRRPYDRADDHYQRRTVFCASVNEPRFLVDDTGTRRWWTVPIESIDYEHSIDMQQLWAEALGWFQAGESWWLSHAEQEQLEVSNVDHEQADPLDELIATK